MNITIRIITLLFALLISANSQSKEYKGFLSARLIVKNSLEYSVRHKFRTNENEALEIPFASPIKTTGNENNKFVLSFTILTESENNFTSRVEVHEKYYSEKGNLYSYKKILQLDTPGEFFSKNNYSLISKSDPNLIIKLEIQKKLTLDEMKKIFDAK